MDGFRFYTGALATDFVGTLGRRLAGGHERLTSPARLGEWLNQASLCPRKTNVTVKQLIEARALREAMYRLLLARMACAGPARTDIDLVNAWARRPLPTPQLTGAVDFTMVLTATRPVTGALAAVADDAIRLLSGPHAPALRACEAGDCGMVYLDQSQKRTRRWCSMRECGNRAKASAHRARRAGAP